MIPTIEYFGKTKTMETIKRSVVDEEEVMSRGSTEDVLGQ